MDVLRRFRSFSPFLEEEEFCFVRLHVKTYPRKPFQTRGVSFAHGGFYPLPAIAAGEDISIPKDAFVHSFILWRTGDTGDPWRVPTTKSKGSEVLPLSLSLTVRLLRPLRNDLHHLVSSGANPRFKKV